MIISKYFLFLISQSIKHIVLKTVIKTNEDEILPSIF